MQLKTYDEMTPDQKLAYKMGLADARGLLPADFPSDEDVEVAAKAAYLTKDSTNQWHWDHTAPQEKYRNMAHAALQAVADARRTEEER